MWAEQLKHSSGVGVDTMKMTTILTGVVCVLLSVLSVASGATIYWTPAHELAPQDASSWMCAGDLDCDGDQDLVLLGLEPVHTYWNTGGPASPTWQMDQIQLVELVDCFGRSGGFGDLDGDGDLDLAISCYYDTFMRFYWNTGGCEEMVWQEDLSVFDGIPDYIGCGQPRLADMDADGDLDLMYGFESGQVQYAENVGSSQLPLYENRGWVDGITPAGRAQACFAVGDIDGDGDLDVVRVLSDTQPQCFENTGTAQSFAFAENPEMIEGAPFPPDGFPMGIELADVDGNGTPDLFLSDGFGQNLLYLNDGVVPVEPTSWGAIKALYR